MVSRGYGRRSLYHQQIYHTLIFPPSHLGCNFSSQTEGVSTEDVDVFTDKDAVMHSSDTVKHTATTVIGRLVDCEISCIFK